MGAGASKKKYARFFLKKDSIFNNWLSIFIHIFFLYYLQDEVSKLQVNEFSSSHLFLALYDTIQKRLVYIYRLDTKNKNRYEISFLFFLGVEIIFLFMRCNKHIITQILIE